MVIETCTGATLRAKMLTSEDRLKPTGHEPISVDRVVNEDRRTSRPCVTQSCSETFLVFNFVGAQKVSYET